MHETGENPFENIGPTRADVLLLCRAVTERWDSVVRCENKALKKIDELLENPKLSARSLGLLAKALDSISKTDLARLKFSMGDADINIIQQQNTTVGVRQEMLQDERYQDYLRERALQEDGDAGAVGSNGKPRALGNGKAPSDGRPGANGHCKRDD